MAETGNEAAWGDRRPAGWRAGLLKLCHRLPAGAGWRRLALWLRKPLKSCLRGPVDIEVWDLQLRLVPQGNLSEQRLLMMPQFLDPDEREALDEELKEGGVFLDIGANAGIYSLWVASRPGQNARVEAFEPDPDLCARLQENLARNNLTNVRLHRYALGEEEGTVHLQRGSRNLGENVISTGGTGREVPMKRLNDVLRDHGIGAVRALKIDVEGHEVPVLRPYFAEVPRDSWPRLIVCELGREPVGPEDVEIGRLLLDHGYEMQKRGRLNGLFYRQEGEARLAARDKPC